MYIIYNYIIILFSDGIIICSEILNYASLINIISKETKEISFFVFFNFRPSKLILYRTKLFFA